MYLHYPTPPSWCWGCGEDLIDFPPHSLMEDIPAGDTVIYYFCHIVCKESWGRLNGFKI
jgi:hypothetical protein